MITFKMKIIFLLVSLKLWKKKAQQLRGKAILLICNSLGNNNSVMGPATCNKYSKLNENKSA